MASCGPVHYRQTEYQASQAEFSGWFGEPVQSYNSAHDRRHQVNAVGSLDLGDYKMSLRWQLGSRLPFTGRLPVVHRLDLSVGREFDVSFGRLEVQAGAINANDRRNMFYYDLLTARRLDQLRLATLASVTLREG